MKAHKFNAIILKHENLDAAYIEFPYNVQAEFGKQGQVKVKATFDGYDYRGSLVKMGFPCHIIGLTQKVREAIHKTFGDTVQVSICEDTEERKVEIPDDLSIAFTSNQHARTLFEKLSFTNRKEYIAWINSAKKEETRAARVENCIRKLIVGKRNPADKD
jgi:hypothetical protein